jgi:transcription initiation factor IIE alpha subunit
MKYNMPVKLTKEQVNERLNNRGIDQIGDYLGNKIKTDFRCDNGHVWSATPGSVLSGKGCPHCAGLSPLSKDIVNGRIKDRGIYLIGEYINSHTKTNFQCDCGHIWSSSPNNILGGNNCPICSHKLIANKLRLSKEIINEKLFDRGIKLYGDYIDSQTKSEFMCNENHIWKSLPASVTHGAGCPICSKNLRLSKDVVNQRLKESNRNIEQIGEYINANTISDFKCECGNIWAATPGNIMAGKSCPLCSKYGYQIDKSGWIYILIFNGHIKYGITNDLDRRLLEHSKNGEYTVATTKLYEDGNIALNWEKNIKIIFGGRFVSKEIMPNGYTETLPLDKLQALLDTVK